MSHIAVLLLVAVGIGAGGASDFLGTVARPTSFPVQPSAAPDLLVARSLPAGSAPSALPRAERVESSPALTALPDARQGAAAGESPLNSIRKYRVQPGDTPGEIAERFGVSVDTVLQANNLSNPEGLQIGEELLILPVSGALHTVSSGDNLHDLALLYGVTAESIAEYNRLADPNSLQVGDKLIVPGGKMQAGRVASSRGMRPSTGGAASGSFRWPSGGSITQYFGENGHTGIDLATGAGSPVYAADGGVVVTALKLGYGYGWHLVIDHGNGYQTLYAHLSAFFVDYGERVGKGDRIGSVGSTGLSTGPHLHFEVTQNGVRVNPLKFLP